MPSTLSIPYHLTIDVHEIEGGGFWGEVRQFPGCVAQAETLEGLESSILRAIRDWWAEPGRQTEETARELAAIQGTTEIPDGPCPLPYVYQPPASWTEADEDESLFQKGRSPGLATGRTGVHRIGSVGKQVRLSGLTRIGSDRTVPGPAGRTG